MADLMKRESGELSQVSAMVRELLSPILESIGTMLEHNTRAMEQIAAAQQATSERIAALEKRVRLQTPLSRSQEKCVNDAIRRRARELLEPRGWDRDRKAVNKLSGVIRRGVLARYGVSCLREAPAYDYETIMTQVGIYNDRIVLRDVEREARGRAEALLERVEPDAGGDGVPPTTGRGDQPGERPVPVAEGVKQ